MRTRFPISAALFLQCLVALFFLGMPNAVSHMLADPAQLAIVEKLNDARLNNAITLNNERLAELVSRPPLTGASLTYLAEFAVFEPIADQADRMRVVIGGLALISAILTAACLVLVIRLERQTAHSRAVSYRFAAEVDELRKAAANHNA